MPLPAFQRAFDQVTILPPSFDFAGAMRLVKTAKDFVVVVDQVEVDSAVWRTKTSQNFTKLRRRVDELAAALPREDVWPQLKPHIERALEAIDAGIKSNSVPVDQDARFAAPLARLRDISPDTARFFRRHLERAEIVRQKQLDYYQKARDNYLILKWDYDPEAQPIPGEPVMSSPEDVERYFESIR